MPTLPTLYITGKLESLRIWVKQRTELSVSILMSYFTHSFENHNFLSESKLMILKLSLPVGRQMENMYQYSLLSLKVIFVSFKMLYH